MNENILENNVGELETLLKGEMHSLLYKRIGSIKIADARISKVFMKIAKEIEFDTTFSVAELFLGAEAVISKGKPKSLAGYVIYSYDKFSTNEKLAKNSVNGIFSLLALNNGLKIDLDAIGGSYSAAELKRFLVIPANKIEKFQSIAQKDGILLTKAGEIVANNTITVLKDNAVIEVVDKSIIDKSSEPISVNITVDNYKAFTEAFLSVCTISLCDRVNVNNVVRFSCQNDINNLVAAAIGYYSAVSQLKYKNVKRLFTSDKRTSVAVPRPLVADGDYFYLLRLRMDEDGLPERPHLAQLNYYLGIKKNEGVIKNVLPVRENILSLLNRLAGDNLSFETLLELPENSYGVVVSVPRGESVNGIKLGYFKNIEQSDQCPQE